MILWRSSASRLAIVVGAGFWSMPILVQAQEAPKENRTLLAPIVVTADKSDAFAIGGSVQRLDLTDMERFSYSDPNRVLRQIPGVYLQEEEGFGLRPNIGIRGSGTDRNARITVMEDGILIAPAPYAAPAAYYFPKMARMSGVEVAKGPAAIKYGPMTVGGAINLFSTPIPDSDIGTLTGKADILGGSYGGRRVHAWTGGWAPLGDAFEIGGLIEGLYDKSDGFKDIDRGGDTGFDLTDWGGKLGFRTADGTQNFEFKYQNYDETSNETYLGLTLDDFKDTPFRRYNASQKDVIDAAHNIYQFSHSYEITPDINLTTTVYRTDTTRAWYKLNDVRNDSDTGWVSLSNILADPDTYSTQMADIVGADGYTGRAGALRVRNNARAYQATGIQSVLTTNFDTGELSHELELSARYHQDEEDRFQQDDPYQMVNGRMILTSAGAPGSQSNRLNEAKAWAFFARDTIEAGPFTFVPGLRYESINLDQTNWGSADPGRNGPTTAKQSYVDVFIPGLSATWSATDEVLLVAGVHRGFASPAPGSDVDPETSWNYESGVKYDSDGWRAGAIGFINSYSNLLGTCTASTGGNCTIGDQFEGGEVSVKGIELTVGRTFGSIDSNGFEVPVTLAYTYTNARFRRSEPAQVDHARAAVCIRIDHEVRQACVAMTDYEIGRLVDQVPRQFGPQSVEQFARRSVLILRGQEIRIDGIAPDDIRGPVEHRREPPPERAGFRRQFMQQLQLPQDRRPGFLEVDGGELACRHTRQRADDEACFICRDPLADGGRAQAERRQPSDTIALPLEQCCGLAARNLRIGAAVAATIDAVTGFAVTNRRPFPTRGQFRKQNFVTGVAPAHEARHCKCADAIIPVRDRSARPDPAARRPPAGFPSARKRRSGCRRGDTSRPRSGATSEKAAKPGAWRSRSCNPRGKRRGCGTNAGTA